jgi:hypothetical protein
MLDALRRCLPSWSSISTVPGVRAADDEPIPHGVKDAPADAADQRRFNSTRTIADIAENRLSAKQRIKAFLLGSRRILTAQPLDILQKYVEAKMGLGSSS